MKRGVARFFSGVLGLGTRRLAISAAAAFGLSVGSSAFGDEIGSSFTPLEAAPPMASPDGPSVLNVPALASPAAATAPRQSSDPDLERRVHELEAIVRQMGTQTTPVTSVLHVNNLQPDSAPGSGGAPGMSMPPEPSSAFNPIGSEGAAGMAPPSSVMGFAGWKDGFYIESAKRDFILRFTGQIQSDYREFLNTNDRKDIDAFLLRRIRFGLEATLAQYYEFRFMPDFGQGNTVIQDAYMNVRYLDALQLQIGKFKQPISYEQLIQDRYVPTLERSLIDQLVPARDVGVALHGENLLENRLDYAVALSNGEINDSGFGDNNNHKDFNGRFAIRPFNGPDVSQWIRYFQVGLSGGVGVEQEAMSPLTLRTPDTVPFFAFNSTVLANGVRYRVSPELAYFNGPLGFLAQYYLQHQQLQPSSTIAGNKINIDLPFHGFVFLTTLLLTGEERTTYSEPISPLRPFNPCCPCSAPGSWELVGRLSHLKLGDEVFAPGAARLADPTKNSDEASEFTLGVNWYWNKWVRMQFNYEHDWFEQPVLLGSNPAVNKLNSQDSLFTRFQIIF